MALDFRGKAGSSALFDALAAAGHPVEILDGVAVVADEAGAQAVVDAFALDQAKVARCADVARYARELRDRLLGGYSPAEMASWPVKRAEAAAYATSGDSAVAPMLAAEAVARQATLAVVAARVAVNAAAFTALESQIAGIYGRHCDAIRALPSFEAVAAYDYSTGWPP